MVASSKIDDLDVDLPKSSPKLSLEWAQDELVGMRRGVVEDGAKMVLLLGLIEEAVAIGDKVLINFVVCDVEFIANPLFM